MGKDKSTFGDGHDTDDNAGSKLEASKEKKYTATKSDMVTLVFKENRKKELHVAGAVYTFYGAGSKIDVPRCVIEHSDFESQRNDFTIKEEA